MRPGTKLAHYEILSRIGKGGMGEVWKARDTKLGREVAIKTLPEEFANDEERLGRLEREAKLLAALNHPNIAAIYGLEEENGMRFLVLELVEGDTLADRLERGAIPTQESFVVALQIAEALEAAHAKGVIHRDLKPANIKVTPDGRVKVLDFGMAKAHLAEVQGDGPVVETISAVVETQPGLLVGTPAYMSPEQARRQPTDSRSDVWAFGSVLFEILTGESPFKGTTVADTIAGVLEREPDLDVLPPHIHPGMRQLVRLCLTKNPKRRWQSIGDVRLEIEEALEDPTGLTAQPIPVTDSAEREVLPFAVGILALAVVAGSIGWFLRPQPIPEPELVVRLHHDLPDDQVVDPSAPYPLVGVSPDGARVAYVANSRLYLWSLEQGEARPLTATADSPIDPVFSPDGRWISYFSRDEGQLRKIPIDRGVPITLSDVDPPYMMASWSGNDTIVYGQRQGIMSVSASGGEPELIVEAQEGETLRVPQILPDGISVLSTVETVGVGSRTTDIVVYSLESNSRKTLVQAALDARYLPTGHLVYAVGDVLYAVSLDLATQELTAGPVPVLEDVLNTGSPNYALGDGGTLAYLPGETIGFRGTLSWIDREGEVTVAIDEGRAYRFVRLSPGGDRFAAVVRDADGIDNIWIHDVESGTPIQLTDDKRAKGSLAWTPDGKQVTFSVEGAIYWQRADGSGPAQLLWSHDDPLGTMNWSADGRFLAFDTAASLLTRAADIWVFSAEEGTAIQFTETDDFEALPAFSPGGEWISYVRRGREGNQVWVAPHPGPGAARQVSRVSGGVQGGWSAWSGERGELYYRGIGANFQKVMVVSVQLEPDFTRSDPRTLFDLPISSSVLDLHPDGEWFLLLQNLSVSGMIRQNARINVVLNWLEELKERVPVP